MRWRGQAGLERESAASGEGLSSALPAAMWVGLGLPSALPCLSFLPWDQQRFLHSCSYTEGHMHPNRGVSQGSLWETATEQLGQEAKEGIKQDGSR